MEWLACKWGTGYRVICEPYQQQNMEFVYGFEPPRGARLVTTKEMCRIIEAYLKEHNIGEYMIGLGMMSLRLEDGSEVVRAKNKGTHEKRGPRRKRIDNELKPKRFIARNNTPTSAAIKSALSQSLVKNKDGNYPLTSCKECASI